jgi:acyl dehydratase
MEETMLELQRPAELDGYVGKTLGTGEWLTVTQEMIDKFAEATGDHQWIHVDVARCAKEMPGGKTIAHGYLTLSLLPQLSKTVYQIKERSRGVNYGSNKVRFTSPVPAGGRVRLHQKLKNVEPIEGGRRLTIEATVEVEGKERPALVAETMSLVFD